MTNEVSIIISTFGDEAWRNMALTRALPSAENQTTKAEVILSHEDTLSEARNNGAKKASGEFLIFLDADDELDSRYVEMMLTGTGDLRQPSTLGVSDGVEDDAPVLIPRRDLFISNFLVIGSMCRKSIFEQVGGFNELPALEDWDLWIRFALAGARITSVPEAIYRVHVSRFSRNQNTKVHHETYLHIRGKYRPYEFEVKSKGLMIGL